MNELLKLLESYFECVKILVDNKLLSESEIFDNLSSLNTKIDADLKSISSKTNESKITFKKTIIDTIALMQKARAWYDTKFTDDKTQQVVYQYYKKNLLPKFTKFWQLCSEYNEEHGYDEEDGLASIKTLIDAMKEGKVEQLGLKSIKTYFNY